MISFRDPGGALVARQDCIFRIVGSGAADLEAFLASKTAQKFLQAGHIPRTDVLGPAQAAAVLTDAEIRNAYEDLSGHLLLEHERIPFASFPYEWPPEMLHAAGVLTLDLAQELLSEGVGLKDATPFNVLFRGPQPVFIDLLSFERRDPGDATWLPYAQFLRTFLLPLMANKYFGLPLDQILSARRDGLEPEEVYRYLGPVQRLFPPFLGLVSMPTWLGARHNQDDNTIYQKKSIGNPEKVRFILDSLLNRLRRTLNRLAPVSGKQSTWSDYMASGNNYAAGQFAAKERFVAEAVREFSPQRVLDVGCNTGHFSFIAARSGASVIAIDYDPVVAGQVWRDARSQKLNVLPLVVNLARPTPATGWRNGECPSFLDRARGSFDAVFMLAVIHHMLVTERVPLPDILDLAAELTRDLLIIEFIEPQDSMFRRLTRGRDELHVSLSVPYFESVCRQKFDILRSERISGAARSLYLLRKKR
ncbi:MAG TPA: class I SAM-dependent methyltransferase [Bryobacteraceae bacterium]|nr:class I SAM-dependent methyltransferase [Bryobacteraceae bacterium]